MPSDPSHLSPVKDDPPVKWNVREKPPGTASRLERDLIPRVDESRTDSWPPALSAASSSDP